MKAPAAVVPEYTALDREPTEVERSQLDPEVATISEVQLAAFDIFLNQVDSARLADRRARFGFETSLTALLDDGAHVKFPRAAH